MLLALASAFDYHHHYKVTELLPELAISVIFMFSRQLHFWITEQIVWWINICKNKISVEQRMEAKSSKPTVIRR